MRQRRLTVLVVAMLAGCLDSPPGGLGDGDAGPDAAPGESDAAPGSCSTIVRNQFADRDEWDPYEDTGATVTVEDDLAHIKVVATESGVWADLTAVPTAPIESTELVASFTIGDGANGAAGISWAIEAGDQYFDLLVDGTKLVAIDAPEGDDSATWLCDPCPDYDPEAHARIRLRAVAGSVHFQTAPAEGDWKELASAPIRSDDDFEALAHAWSDAGETSDMTVTELVWRRCDF